MSKAIVDRTHHIPFFEDLSKARRRVLLLDYDGTIAPFSADRSLARPYFGIHQLLQTIIATCRTDLIVISGRAAHEVPPLLSLNPPPEVWGAHGLERIGPEGHYEQIAGSDEAFDALAQCEAMLERQGLGRCLEIKLAAVAVHWRGVAPSKVLTIRRKAFRVLESLAKHPDLMLAEFDGGVELRLRTANKGNVVRTLTSRFDDTVPIAYLGDDSSDEDAFCALNGRGLTVLVRPKPRVTAAQMWLKPPDELIDFLAAWIRSCTGRA